MKIDLLDFDKSYLSNENYKKFDAEIKDYSTGKVVFSAKDLRMPKHWSNNACNIFASKYMLRAGVPHEFRFHNNTKRLPVGHYLHPRKPVPDAKFSSEKSAMDVFNRLSFFWAFKGLTLGYFDTLEDAENYQMNMANILFNQYGAPNSPQWFNAGVYHYYGIEGPETGLSYYDDITEEVKTSKNTYEYPQLHACFINNVEDKILGEDSITDFITKESTLFKHGSGSGSNWSKIRGKDEKLSSGGKASGVISFLKIADTNAGSIKSGGKCLAPNQKVYTAKGPVAVKDLTESEFLTIAFTPSENRFTVKKAEAWKSGNKKLYRVTTDKGSFELSGDHPVLLAGTREHVEVRNLKENQRLFVACINDSEGYVSVHLKNGKKGKEKLHRLIAKDIMGVKLEKQHHVHHKDGDKSNNDPKNLEVLSASDHARHHCLELCDKGDHVFQNRYFGKSGSENPVHKESDFWKDEQRVQDYKKKQSELMTSERSKVMQKESCKSRMINYGHEMINKGLQIDDFHQYCQSRKAYAGYSHPSNWKKAIDNNFGCYGNYIDQLNNTNHKVLSIEELQDSEVYDVEVFCDSIDDKTPDSGHNFLIWPSENDTKFGSGIMVSNTRRAAKLVVLDADHPDIEEFVEWKVSEENKAAMMYAGSQILHTDTDATSSIPSQLLDRKVLGIDIPKIDIGFDGEAYSTVSGQNSNNSVSVTDTFMNLVESKGMWELKNRYDGTTSKTVPADELFDKICKSAWSSADPGLFFHDNINKMHTCKADGDIVSANPCIEYMFLNDTACNLASINLIKFLDEEKMKFSFSQFKKHIDLWITTLDISVSAAGYPTKKIAEKSIEYRTLGLGYANLGGLLMAMGLPYDSNEGRDLAAVITRHMSLQSVNKSKQLGKDLKSFPAFERNKKHYKIVLSEQFEDTDSYIPNMRNAQLTLLAPTGTIGLIMDVATTGIEPDFSLLKYKTLSGGGTQVYTNPLVEKAFKALGYGEDECEKYTKAVLEYVETGVKSSDYLKIPDNHLRVFDCSNDISWKGHIDMMAAVQPYLSGAISKTVNMPETATVDDVRQGYMYAWQSGLKAVSIYRDNSKMSQPLSHTKTDNNVPSKSKLDTHTEVSAIDRPIRDKLPSYRKGYTAKLSIGGTNMYLKTGEYPDGRLGEIFIDIYKEGAVVRSLLNAFSRSVSISLQYGVPLKQLIRSFIDTKFEPSGLVQGSIESKFSTSVIDLVFKELEFLYINKNRKEIDSDDRETDANIAVYEFDDTTDEQLQDIFTKTVSNVVSISEAKPAYSSQNCSNCGNYTLRKNGSCHVCDTCGTTTGCS